jgi:alkylation response protein AidB-like acyl-CoA dehydrogenase
MLTDGIAAILGRDGLRGNSVGGYPAANHRTWRALGEMGVFALPIPSQFGGLELGHADIGTVMRALGRFATVEPFMSTVVQGAGVVAGCESEAIRQAVLPAVAAGELKLALAYTEPGSRYILDRVATRADAGSDGYVLSGHKSVVLGAPDADRIVVSARNAGDDAISLFLVDRSAPGLTIQAYFLIDGRQAGEVLLDNVDVPFEARLAGPATAMALLEQVIDEATIAACHESLGAMEHLNEITLKHCRERIAFGQPIAKNQVVQHRLVDMQVAIEHAAAIVELATGALADGRVRPRALISAAKVAVLQEAKFIGEAAVQLHGAGGTTEDLDVGRLFKRLLVNGMVLGDHSHHLQRFMDHRIPAHGGVQ